ncbi:hypothetical protein LJC60_08940 [Ruminococcaceae bacterium OttesenSCG-928-D13]|nr:hypothetical protein [Ruminococcaceae bacterium OttesenSCG-928-D13]
MNVGEYLALFVITKWIAFTVVGTWILLSALYPSKATAGYLLALAFPIASELVRISISAIDRLQIVRYTSIASLLQTNEILGTYRNVSVFGNPVSLVAIELVSGLFYFLTFSSLYVVYYSYSYNIQAPSRTHSNWIQTRIFKSLWAYESYKILVINGGIIILLIVISTQCYIGFSSESHINPNEIYFKYYMDRLEGKMTNEKVEFLNEEMKSFEGLIKLNSLLDNSDITQDEYNERISAYTHQIEKYNVFSNIYDEARYSDDPLKHMFIYHSRYPKFLGIDTNDNILEYLFLCVSMAIIIPTILTYELQSGMAVINSVTPGGRKKLIGTKLKLLFIVSIVLALSSFASKYIIMIRYDGFSAAYLPLRTLPFYSSLDNQMPIVVFIIIVIFVRRKRQLTKRESTTRK